MIPYAAIILVIVACVVVVAVTIRSPVANVLVMFIGVVIAVVYRPYPRRDDLPLHVPDVKYGGRVSFHRTYGLNNSIIQRFNEYCSKHISRNMPNHDYAGFTFSVNEYHDSTNRHYRIELEYPCMYTNSTSDMYKNTDPPPPMSPDGQVINTCNGIYIDTQGAIFKMYEHTLPTRMCDYMEKLKTPEYSKTTYNYENITIHMYLVARCILDFAATDHPKYTLVVRLPNFDTNEPLNMLYYSMKYAHVYAALDSTYNAIPIIHYTGICNKHVPKVQRYRLKASDVPQEHDILLLYYKTDILYVIAYFLNNTPTIRYIYCAGENHIIRDDQYDTDSGRFRHNDEDYDGSTPIFTTFKQRYLNGQTHIITATANTGVSETTSTSTVSDDTSGSSIEFQSPQSPRSFQSVRSDNLNIGPIMLQKLKSDLRASPNSHTPHQTGHHRHRGKNTSSATLNLKSAWEFRPLPDLPPNPPPRQPQPSPGLPAHRPLPDTPSPPPLPPRNMPNQPGGLIYHAINPHRHMTNSPIPPTRHPQTRPGPPASRPLPTTPSPLGNLVVASASNQTPSTPGEPPYLGDTPPRPSAQQLEDTPDADMNIDNNNAGGAIPTNTDNTDKTADTPEQITPGASTHDIINTASVPVPVYITSGLGLPAPRKPLRR